MAVRRQNNNHHCCPLLGPSTPPTSLSPAGWSYRYVIISVVNIRLIVIITISITVLAPRGFPEGLKTVREGPETQDRLNGPPRRPKGGGLGGSREPHDGSKSPQDGTKLAPRVSQYGSKAAPK